MNGARNSLECDAFDLDPRFSKIDEQACPMLCRSQIIQALRPVRIFETSNRLQLNQQATFDKNVRKIFANDDIVVQDSDWHLLRTFNTTLRQFVGQSVLVDPLQESVTERVRYGKRAANNPFSQVVMLVSVFITIHRWSITVFWRRGCA